MRARYHFFAILLHWSMALAILGMIVSGLLIENGGLAKTQLFALFQWHKSFGITVLLALFLRLIIRIITVRPSVPLFMKPWELLASKYGHAALYIGMFAVPMTGWLMVSSSKLGLPTILFGKWTWPHIPGLTGNQIVSSLSHEAHELLAYCLMVLIAIHIAAVLKHAMLDKHNLLPRMGIGRIRKEIV
jgi:cytochrome b561